MLVCLYSSSSLSSRTHTFHSKSVKNKQNIWEKRKKLKFEDSLHCVHLIIIWFNFNQYVFKFGTFAICLVVMPNTTIKIVSSSERKKKFTTKQFFTWFQAGYIHCCCCCSVIVWSIVFMCDLTKTSFSTSQHKRTRTESTAWQLGKHDCMCACMVNIMSDFVPCDCVIFSLSSVSRGVVSISICMIWYDSFTTELGRWGPSLQARVNVNLIIYGRCFSFIYWLISFISIGSIRYYAVPHLLLSPHEVETAWNQHSIQHFYRFHIKSVQITLWWLYWG